MKRSDFISWAEDFGADSETLSVLTDVAPCDNMVSLFSFAGIKQINEDQEYPIEAAAVAAGFFVIGSCGNGDPVAVDLKNGAGSIHFVCHEELDGPNVFTVKVADSLREFSSRLDQGKLPMDYFEALDRKRNSASSDGSELWSIRKPQKGQAFCQESQAFSA